MNRHQSNARRSAAGGFRRAAALGCVVAGAVMSLNLSSAAAISSGDIVVSAAVYAPSTLSSCAGSAAGAAPIRAAVDLLDDSWRALSASTGLAQFEVLQLPVADPVAAHPTVGTFVGSAVTAQVSLRNVPQSTILGFGGSALDPSTGSLATVNANGPGVGVGTSRTLQECAPYPASHYGASTADQTPAWSETAGDGTTLNGVLFQFSSPVRAFGAWFGDVESRAGTPAWLKLFDAAGLVVWEGPVGGEAATDAECGGSAEVDALACGNQGTRWVGFVSPNGEQVSAMLLTVGDDDSCAQVASAQCGGGSEHLSFVGATLGVDDLGDPNPTTTSTSTSTSTSTTSTSSSTTSTTLLMETTTTEVTTTSSSTTSSSTTTAPVEATTTSLGATTSSGPTTTSVAVDPVTPTTRPWDLVPATGGNPSQILTLALLFGAIGALLLVPRRIPRR